jgi:dihydrofolate reductase
MNLAMIVAMTPSGVIGKDNDLPWPRIKEDMRFFKRQTKGHVIIMGRKTYESIGKPLPHRANFVLTQNPNYKAPGCLVFTDLDKALTEAYELDKQPVVIGGSGIYRALLPKTSILYLTEVKQEYEGDVNFPMFDRSAWDREVIDETDKVIFNKLTRK